MNGVDQEIFNAFRGLLEFARRVEAFTGASILGKINRKKVRLFKLPPQKRIFLFILTRAIKTFSSIHLLCRQGYGQDASPVLRSLLENLISVKYILSDPKTADEKTRRFVGYKWIILRKQISDLRQVPEEQLSPSEKEILEKETEVLEHAENFKKEFRIKSDRALLTWSGKTVKEMARSADRGLAQEYDSAFRMCSRFSHAGVLGDHEYMIHGRQKLTFSPAPSSIGVKQNLERAVRYMLDFLSLADRLFALEERQALDGLEKHFDGLRNAPSPQGGICADQPAPGPAVDIRQSVIRFELKKPLMP